MASDDVAARGFRDYEAALLLLERRCGWNRRTAHGELMKAVNDGRVRRNSAPTPPQYRYDTGAWNPHEWHAGVGIIGLLEDGPPIVVGIDKPGFTEELHSVADLERLIAEERGARPGTTPTGQDDGDPDQTEPE